MKSRLVSLLLTLVLAPSTVAEAAPLCAQLRQGFSALFSKPVTGGQPWQLADGTTVSIRGRPGPGIPEDLLVGAQQLANGLGRPYVIFGSRQTGISEKSGKPFRPDSDADIGAFTPEDLMETQITDEAYVRQFHPLFHHGAAALFESVDAAVGKGYLVIFPK